MESTKIDLNIPNKVQDIKTKCKLGLLLSDDDYNYILSDLNSQFDLRSITEITEEIDNYIKLKYFAEYNKQRMFKRIVSYVGI